MGTQSQATQISLESLQTEQHEAGTRQVSWHDAARNMLEGRWQVPKHQREFRWPSWKRIAFRSKLSAGLRPYGMITTYDTASDGAAVFLNDGLQRVSTCCDMMAHPEDYGVTSEYVEELLRSRTVVQEHCHHSSHEDALQAFQQVNLGTALSAYEFYKGALVYAPSYDSLIAPNLERYHARMNELLASICDKGARTDDAVEKTHKYLRHNLVILYHVLSGNKYVSQIRVATPVKLEYQKGRVEAVEHMLRDILKDDPPRIRDAVSVAIRQAEDTVAIARSVHFDKMGYAAGDPVSITTVRWLIEVRAWVENNQIPRVQFAEFCEGVLRNAKRTGKVHEIDKDGNLVAESALALGYMSKIGYVGRIVGCDLMALADRKRNQTERKMAGFDSSHVQPFATHGNGETFPEPSSINRARGARPVDSVDDSDDSRAAD